MDIEIRPATLLEVIELIAKTSDAYAALWRYSDII
jgi:hypothetical protein